MEFFIWHGALMTSVIAISFTVGYYTATMMQKRKFSKENDNL